MNDDRKNIECETCNAYINNACSISHSFSEPSTLLPQHCPCKECIVKIMCTITCPKFKRYMNGYHEYMKYSVIEFQKYLEDQSKRTRWVKVNMSRGHKFVVDAFQEVKDLKK